MRLRSVFLPGILLAAGAVSSPFLLAQSPVQSCNATPAPAWCAAVEGDRSQGWRRQHRSEVMARNGMVAASQPLAAQVGLDILKKGGNAIDAAVATAATLTLMEPMNVGPAGDLFAIVYVAKENKLYALNASGMAPTGQTVARMNAAGYAASEKTRGPGSGMPSGGILTVTVPGAVWGWDEVLHRFGTMTFKETLQPDAVRRTSLFNPEVTQRLIRDHEEKRTNAGYQLWGLLTLFLWLKRWNIEIVPSEEQTLSSRVASLAAAS